MNPKTTRELLKVETDKLKQRVVELEARLAACNQDKKDQTDSDVLFRTLVEQVDSAVVIIQDNKIVYANPFVEKALGYTVEEVVNTLFLDYTDPDEREATLIIHKKRMNGDPLPQKYERILRHKNGTKIIAEISGKVIPYNGKPANMVTLNDVTARKQTEQLLIENESILNQAQEVASMGSYVWNLRDDSLVWSENMYKIAGINKEDFTGTLIEVMQKIIHPEDMERMTAEIAEMVEEKETKPMVFRIIRPDGAERILRSSSRFQSDEHGNPEKCIGVHYDITEQQQKEIKMREQASMLHTLVNAPIDTLALMEQNGTLLAINEKGAERMHATPERLVGKNFYKLFPKEVALSREDYVNQVFETGKAVSFEDERDGSYLLNTIYPVFDEKRNVKHAAVFATDITQQKQMEIALRTSEEKYKFLAENTADVIWIVDLNFKVTYVSPAIEKVLGFTPEERMKQSLEEMIAPESLQTVVARYEEELPREEKSVVAEDRLITIEIEYYHKDGSTVWMENSVRPLRDKSGAFIGIAGASRDIRERKQAEKILKESERKYRTLVERSIQGVVIALANPVRLGFASSPMERISGYSPEELMAFDADKISQLIHPADREEFFVNFRKRLEGENIPAHAQYRILHRNGETRWVEIYSSVIEFQGHPATQTVFLDITERKRAEDEFRKSEEKYRRIVDTANEGIWMMDKNYCTTYVNEKMAAILGYTVDELTGKDIKPYIFPDDWPDQEKVLKRREQGKRDQYERRFLHKDASVLWLLVSANPLKDENGEFAGSFAMFTDITDRKKAEDELRNKKIELEEILRALPDALIYADVNRRIVKVNPAFEKMFGYRPEEVLGQKTKIIYAHSDEFKDQGKIRYNVKARGLYTPYEINYKRKDGRIFPSETVGTPVFGADGKPSGFIGLVREITERKIAEKKLRDQANELQWLFKSMINAFVLFESVFDEQGKFISYRFIYINDAYERVTGVKNDAVSGKTVHEVWPDTEQSWIENYGEVAVTGISKTFDMYHSPTKKLYHCNVYRPWDSEDRFCVIFEDITEKEKAEIALVQSENKFRDLFNEAPVGYHEIDADGRIRQINKTGLEMLGYESDEMVGNFICNFFADKTCRMSIEHKLKGQLETGSGYERLFVRKDGSTLSVLVEDRLLEDSNGKIIGMRETIQDISELKKMQHELQSHLKFFEILIDTMPNPVFYKDTEGRYQGGNQAFASEILGMKKEDIIGKTVADLTDAIPHELAANYHRKDMELIKNPGKQFYEAKVRCADGKQRDFIFNKATYNDLRGNVAGMIGVMVDISQQKKLEQELRHSMKMEAIGRLAGGIAHDFNNLLTAILGNAEFAMYRLSQNNPMREDLNEILTAGNRAATLTQQLLAFSRKQPLKRKVTNLNHVVMNIKKMLQRIIGEDIDLVTELDANMGSCYVDPSQVEQVIMNLAVNARDAMPDGGKLFIRTENVEIENSDSKSSENGKAVCLVVQDSGSGIDGEILERIFDPFFTTKGVGGGTGLGLSVVHGIVEQHEGWLKVDSEIGDGTTFRVFFPGISDIAEVEKVEAIPIKPFQGNKERILLVEDEKDVRNFISKILTYHNYTVFSEDNAAKALSTFDKEDGQFDLLLSDVVLPDKSGHDLAKQLMKKKPGLRILLSSGYMDEKVGWEGIQAHEIPFLQKPYDLRELLEAIQKALSGD